MRYQTRSHLPDILPAVLWREGVVALGGRRHFCLVGAGDDCRRSIEWKAYDWLIGFRPY